MTKKEFYELYKEIQKLRVEVKKTITEWKNNNSWENYYNSEETYGLYRHFYKKYYEELMRRFYKMTDDNPQLLGLLKQIKENYQFEEEFEK